MVGMRAVGEHHRRKSGAPFFAIMCTALLLLPMPAWAMRYDVPGGSMFDYKNNTTLGEEKEDVYYVYVTEGTELSFSVEVTGGGKMKVYFVKGGAVEMLPNSTVPAVYDVWHSSNGYVYSFSSNYLATSDEKYSIVITGNRSTAYQIGIYGDSGYPSGFGLAISICIGAFIILTAIVIYLFKFGGGRLKPTHTKQKEKKRDEKDVPYNIR